MQRSAPRIGNGIILHSLLIIYDKKHKNVQVGNQREGSVRVKLSVVAEVHTKKWTMTYKCGGRADADTWCHTVQVLRDSCMTLALLQPVNGRTALKQTFYTVLYFTASLRCCHSICPCWTSASLCLSELQVVCLKHAHIESLQLASIQKIETESNTYGCTS